MSRVVEFRSKKGPVIYIEMPDPGAPAVPARTGERPAAAGEQPAAVPRVFEKAKKTFEDALDTAKPGIEAALDSLRNLIQQPEETEIEFGLKIDAEAGAIFASAGAEATFTVRLTWKKQTAANS